MSGGVGSWEAGVVVYTSGMEAALSGLVLLLKEAHEKSSTGVAGRVVGICGADKTSDLLGICTQAALLMKI